MKRRCIETRSFVRNLTRYWAGNTVYIYSLFFFFMNIYKKKFFSSYSKGYLGRSRVCFLLLFPYASQHACVYSSFLFKKKIYIYFFMVKMPHKHHISWDIIYHHGIECHEPKQGAWKFLILEHLQRIRVTRNFLRGL